MKKAKAEHAKLQQLLALPCNDREKEGTMRRERALKVVLVVVGLLFTAGVYPLIGSYCIRLIRIQATP